MTQTHAQPAAAEHGTPAPAFDMFACDTCPACGAVVEEEEVRSGWRVDEQVCCQMFFAHCHRHVRAQAYTHAHAQAHTHAHASTHARTHTHTHAYSLGG